MVTDYICTLESKVKTEVRCFDSSASIGDTPDEPIELEESDVPRKSPGESDVLSGKHHASGNYDSPYYRWELSPGCVDSECGPVVVGACTSEDMLASSFRGACAAGCKDHSHMNGSCPMVV